MAMLEEDYFPETISVLAGLAYLHGWGVRRNKEKAKKYFSYLSAGQVVVYGYDSEKKDRLLGCRVLEVREDRVLLQANDGHRLPESLKPKAWVAKRFDTWDKSLQRFVLNDKYFDQTFNKDLQKQILTTEVVTPENPYCKNKHNIKSTKDKVFLLSLQEHIRYFDRNPIKASSVTWTLTEEKTDLKTGVTWYQVDTDIPAFYYGKNPNEAALENVAGEFFRTPGENAWEFTYSIGDNLFYTGAFEGTRKSRMGYKPAFWVSLK